MTRAQRRRPRPCCGATRTGSSRRLSSTSGARGRTGPPPRLSSLCAPRDCRLAWRRGCVDAAWFLTLLVPDLEEDALAWIGGGLTPETDPARFAAFQARAKAELKFDPAKIAPVAAAGRMLRRETGWGGVWDRFAKGG